VAHAAAFAVNAALIENEWQHLAPTDQSRARGWKGHKLFRPSPPALVTRAQPTVRKKSIDSPDNNLSGEICCTVLAESCENR